MMWNCVLYAGVHKVLHDTTTSRRLLRACIFSLTGIHLLTSLILSTIINMMREVSKMSWIIRADHKNFGDHAMLSNITCRLKCIYRPIPWVISLIYCFWFSVTHMPP